MEWRKVINSLTIFYVSISLKNPYTYRFRKLLSTEKFCLDNWDSIPTNRRICIWSIFLFNDLFNFESLGRRNLRILLAFHNHTFVGMDRFLKDISSWSKLHQTWHNLTYVDNCSFYILQRIRCFQDALHWNCKQDCRFGNKDMCHSLVHWQE